MSLLALAAKAYLSFCIEVLEVKPLSLNRILVH